MMKIRFRLLQSRLYERARGWEVTVAAALVLISLYGARQWLGVRIRETDATAQALSHGFAPLDQEFAHYQTLVDLKARDVAQFKAGFSDQARSRKTLFESGLSLQEERRLLEKQYDLL